MIDVIGNALFLLFIIALNQIQRIFVEADSQ